LEHDVSDGLVAIAVEHDPPPRRGRSIAPEHLFDEGGGLARVAVMAPPDDLGIAPDRMERCDVVLAERLEVEPRCVKDRLDHGPERRVEAPSDSDAAAIRASLMS
jgi:hypothetical protein